jgi:hypothetical protein
MQSVQAILPGVLAEIVRRQPPSAGRTAFAWTVAVGPALARAATVELHGGILHVTPKDARWTREIDRARGTILSRLQALLGPDVREIRLAEAPRPSHLDARY